MACRLAGTTNSFRKDSLNRMSLQLVGDRLPEGSVMEPFDLKDIPFFDADYEAHGFPAAARALAELLARCDGLVIACPEYNHSMPAALKNAIDWLSRMKEEPLRGLPVMILSATKGILGGARVQYELRRVLDSVGALPLVRPEVFIGMADRKFDDSGLCIDPQTCRFVDAQLVAFMRWIESTRSMRQSCARLPSRAVTG